MPGIDESIGLALIAGIIGAMCVSVCTAPVYPRLRSHLATVSPGLRSNLLLALLSLPVVTGGALVIITLSPVLDYGPVTHHCHTVTAPGCVPHSLQTFDRSMSLAILLMTTGLMIWPVVQRLGSVIRFFHIKRGLHLTAAFDPERKLYVIDDNRPLAFSMGLFNPAVFISSGLQQHLETDELDAVIHHERAHIHRRDTVRLIAAEILAFAHGPRTGTLMLEDLHLACEQACDEYASRQTGKRLGVAATIMKVERLFAAFPHVIPRGVNRMTGSSVPARIECLLSEPEDKDAPVIFSACITIVILALMVFLSAEPLHHLLESLL